MFGILLSNVFMGLVLRLSSEFVDRSDVGGSGSVKAFELVASAVVWPIVDGCETPLMLRGWDDASMMAMKIHRCLL